SCLSSFYRFLKHTFFSGLGEYSEVFMQARQIIGNLQPISNIEDEQLPNIPPEATTMFNSYTKMDDILQPIHPVGFKGKIYLLVDSSVYSASEGFAAFAKGIGTCGFPMNWCAWIRLD
ncbi:hypothetical protein, partial [Paenibacillus sp.]|uniref:hypothetical protein n=1 Tax=Paenibacillus sp. TaxID=58172 RepID=UPI0028A5AAFC